jgi:cytochrome c oxidase assembly protein subunit 15
MANAASPNTPGWARWWVLGLGVLVLAMVLVGGATRLTDSGLSITEWRPVTGALPPLSDAHWAQEFAKYQQSSQYQMMNYGMSLEAFKGIYWWEWAHRLLGRTIGGYLLFPLLFLTFTRKLVPAKLKELWFIGVLIGVQGFIGWWMVASGLVNRISVSPYRLATHLGVALVILALTWRLFLRWDADGQQPAGARNPLLNWPILLTALVFFQMILGAFVAGLDAGRSHTDWPTIDGRLFPGQYAALEPLWRNLFENTQAVQFNHRVVGYLTAAAALFVAWRFRATSHRKLAASVGHMALLQAALGVIAVITASPLWIGMLHQAGALALFLLANALWVSVCAGGNILPNQIALKT